MKTLLILFLTISISFSQNEKEENEVKKVIETLFEGMKESDSLKVKNTFSTDAIAYTTFTGKDGNPHLKTSNLSGFFQQIAKSPKGSLNEVLHSWNIKIDGTLASVWTEYTFYFKDKKSHCGVNSFQLFKSKEGWKIIYLIDTRRRSNCNN